MAACDCATTPLTAWDKLARRPYGLKRLGQGIDKVGFALPCGAHVLKVSHTGTESQQIRLEVAVWNACLGTAIQPELAAILLYDPNHTWLVVERADMSWPAHVSPQEQMRRFRTFGDRMTAYGFRDLQRVGTNCGLRQGTGRVILVDYGIAGERDGNGGLKPFDPHAGRKARKAARKAAWAAAHPRLPKQVGARAAAGAPALGEDANADWAWAPDGGLICRHCAAHRGINADLKGHLERHHGGRA